MKYEYQFFGKNTGLSDKVFDVLPAKRVKQTHGDNVVIVDEGFNQDDWIEADGIVTSMLGTPIAVITADCAPILLYGKKGGKPMIGAAHAGWQGALGGIIENTVHAMGCDAGTIKAFIGPCIDKQSYEVSKGFEKPFTEHNKIATQFFTDKNEDKLLFDLKEYCAWRLRSCEVSDIDISDIDTLTNPKFHSHRGGADGAKGERNLSAIMICG
jgi:YfiH family protein